MGGRVLLMVPSGSCPLRDCVALFLQAMVQVLAPVLVLSWRYMRLQEIVLMETEYVSIIGCVDTDQT